MIALPAIVAGHGRLVAEVPLTVARLNGGQPIITSFLFDALGASAAEGANINGPSVIRIPDWIPVSQRADPAAEYYLYFAHHHGDYVRLAWSDTIEGPWQLYRVGAGATIGQRGVLDLGPTDSIDVGNGLSLLDHVASPDALVDEVHQRVVLCFHAPAEFEAAPIGQRTFVATSSDGLEFRQGIEPVSVGAPYFRVFRREPDWFAIADHGQLYRAANRNDPWTPPASFDFGDDLWPRRGDNPFQADLYGAGLSLTLRHTAVRSDGDVLQIFHTRVGDSPERILLTTIDSIAGSQDAWDPTFPPQEVLRASPGWEGGAIPATPSAAGEAPEDVNQLRDPYVFEDRDGATYLFYAGRGEDAIGVARLEMEPCVDLDGDGTTGCNDCDDTDASVHPGAPQRCDGVNNDCADASWPNLAGTNEGDDDLDGLSECAGDCDDSRSTVYPGAPQLCNGRNDDCDDPSWPDVPTIELDLDGDSISACEGDCDDGNPAMHPGAVERCNGLDDDCDDRIDEGPSNSEDTDGDGVHELCDNCPSLANPNQDDADGDRVGDLCDNCPAAANPRQSDVDQDDEGDVCDLDDGLIFVLFLDQAGLEWQEEQGFDSWNWYRGDFGAFLSTGELTQEPGTNPLAVRQCGLLAAATLDVLPAPTPGVLAFYLVSGVVSGVEGDLGTASSGTPRFSHHPCR